MSTLFSLTLPIFIVVGFGFIAVKRGIVPEGAVPALNAFVFTFAMPALIIPTVARQDPSTLFVPALLGGWLIGGVTAFAIGMLLARLLARDRLGAMGVTGQATSVGNVGFLGLPLVLEAFGPQAAGPLAAALIIDLVVLVPLSILLLEFGQGGGGGLRALAGALRGAVLNPFLLSILIGLVIALSGLPVPDPVYRMMDFLGAAAAPTALFALGVSLAARRVEGELVPIAAVVGAKLILHPLIVFAVLSALSVPSATVATATVLAAMPVAGNAFVIAQRYETRVRRISTAVFLSTALAVVTVTLALDLAARLTS